MTKYFEEYLRTNVEDLDTLKFEFKGEITIVISEKTLTKKLSQNLDESDKKLIDKMINKLSVKEITNLLNQRKKSRKEKFTIIVLK